MKSIFQYPNEGLEDWPVTKDWYIILPDKKVLCSLITISTAALTMVLNYEGVSIKIKIKNMSDYRMAKSGKEINATAISQKNKQVKKPIKIVFK